MFSYLGRGWSAGTFLPDGGHYRTYFLLCRLWSLHAVDPLVLEVMRRVSPPQLTLVYGLVRVVVAEANVFLSILLQMSHNSMVNVLFFYVIITRVVSHLARSDTPNSCDAMSVKSNPPTQPSCIHCMPNLPSPIKYNGLTHTVYAISLQHAYSYIQQTGRSAKSMNAKNTKKSPIHENAGREQNLRFW